MGRTASGVRGINLEDSSCVGIETAKGDDNIIIVTEKGYGKKTLISEYRKTKRGSKGVKALSITDKNGGIAAVKRFVDNSDLIKKNTVVFSKTNTPFVKVSSVTNLAHVFLQVALNTFSLSLSLYIYIYTHTHIYI